MKKKQKFECTIIDDLGRRHLEEVNMSYLQHLNRAWLFSWIGLRLGLKAFTHGCLPCLFETCAKDTIEEMTLRYSSARVKKYYKKKETSKPALGKYPQNGDGTARNPGKLAGIPPKVLAKGLPRKTRKG